MKYFKVTNDIVQEFTDGAVVVGRKTDEPKWTRELKWVKVTTSQDALYSYFVTEDDSLDVKEAEVVELREIENVYTTHFPVAYENTDTMERVSFAVMSITPSEKIRTITTAEQICVAKEISSKLALSVEGK